MPLLHLRRYHTMQYDIVRTCWANCCAAGASGTKTGAVYVSKWMDMVRDGKGGVMNNN